MNQNFKPNMRKIGENREKIVCDYLIGEGFTILETNFNCFYGEIDIIASHNNYIIFIEVKYRKNAALGYPEESINPRKQQRIIKTSLYYIHKNRISINSNFRYDVIAITGNKINHIKNAFTL